MDELEKLIKDLQFIIKIKDVDASIPSNASLLRTYDLEEEHTVRHSHLSELNENNPTECNHCNEKITGEVNALIFGPLAYHPNHFICCICKVNLIGKSLKERNTHLYCMECYEKKFSLICTFCRESVQKNFIRVMDNAFHRDHFFCAFCGIKLGSSDPFWFHNNRAYCTKDYAVLFAKTCEKCKESLLTNLIMALGKHWHKDCFRCTTCDVLISTIDGFSEWEGNPYCDNHLPKIN